MSLTFKSAFSIISNSNEMFGFYFIFFNFFFGYIRCLLSSFSLQLDIVLWSKANNKSLFLIEFNLKLMNADSFSTFSGVKLAKSITYSYLIFNLRKKKNIIIFVSTKNSYRPRLSSKTVDRDFYLVYFYLGSFRNHKK